MVSWMSNNLSGSYKRSVGMAMHIGIGNLGGVSNAATGQINERITNKIT